MEEAAALKYWESDINWDNETITVQHIQSMQTRVENLGIRRTILQFPWLRNHFHVPGIFKFFPRWTSEKPAMIRIERSKTVLFDTEVAQ